MKKQNALRRTITGNRADHLEACAETRKPPEEARRKKWQEFLADLANNPDLASKRRTIKSLSRNTFINNIRGIPGTQEPNLHRQQRQSQRLHEGIRSRQPPSSQQRGK